MRRGFRIVSAGHLYDRDFYLRMYDICRQFQYAVSNAFGTHLFVTVASGCSFSYVESSAITRTLQGQSYQAPELPALDAIKQQAASLFAAPQEQITADQQAFVDHWIGADCERTPRELRRIFRQAEWLDKFGPLPRWQGASSAASAFPPVLHRGMKRLRSLVRSAQKRLPLARSRKQAA